MSQNARPRRNLNPLVNKQLSLTIKNATHPDEYIITNHNSSFSPNIAIAPYPHSFANHNILA